MSFNRAAVCLLSTIFVSCFFSRLEAQDLSRLEAAWGLNSLSKKMRHPLEKVEFTGEKKDQLRVSVWYEDLSVTKASPPDQRLFCRFMHNFIYGAAKLRSKSKELLPDLAFNRYPQLKSIQFDYFAVLYQNKPMSPYWDKAPSAPGKEIDPEAKLRVTWTREETAIPYLSLELTRAEWKKVSALLSSKEYLNASEFRSQVCREVYDMIPYVKSDFASIARFLDKATGTSSAAR